MIIRVNPHHFTEEAIRPAADILRQGGLCAFPTETVYGLGASVWNEEAVGNIFRAKGRPNDNPLIVHIYDRSQLAEVCAEVPARAKLLMDKFWGGPLTLIMPKADKLSKTVTAGLDTVAVRLPSHPVAYALLRACGIPIAAPSANLSGKPSPTAAKHVIADMEDRADVIIDGGDCLYGVESTVLDLSVPTPAILRPGAVTRTELEETLQTEVTFGFSADAPKSPGMKYKHYAPNAPVYVVDGAGAADEIHRRIKAEDNVGVLCYGCAPDAFAAPTVLWAGKDVAAYAASLYYNLREFDSRGVAVIYAIPPTAGGMGDAVLNRLYKAAGGKIIHTA